MTIQEFKTKAENSEELKKALKEAMEKDEEALAAFLKAQGVEIASRVELSEDDLDAVAGGISGKKIKNVLKELFTLNDVEQQHYKDLYNDTKKFVNKVVNDTLYTH